MKIGNTFIAVQNIKNVDMKAMRKAVRIGIRKLTAANKKYENAMERIRQAVGEGREPSEKDWRIIDFTRPRYVKTKATRRHRISTGLA